MSLSSATHPCPDRQKPFSLLFVDHHLEVKDACFEAMASLWNEQGVELFSADDGQQAMDYLNARSIDLVVSEYQLPKKNGLALFHQLIVHSPMTRFLLFSGAPREHTWKLRRLLRPSLDAHVEKPNIPLLESIIRHQMDSVAVSKEAPCPQK